MLKKFFSRLYDEFSDIRLVASSLAFATLLSLIPFLAITLAAFKSFGMLDMYYPIMEGLVLSYMKEATGVTVTKFIKGTLQGLNAKTLGVSGAIFLLWASFGLIRSIDIAFNRIWKIKISTAFHKRVFLHFIILLAAPLFLGIFAALKAIFASGTDIIFIISLIAVLFFLFKKVPDTHVNSIAALVCSVLTACLLKILQSTFLWVSLKVFSTNKIYGSLASMPIFLIWLLMVWYVVLTGVAFCAFLQQKVFKKP